MLDVGAIRPSNSPWASAVVLVQKKDGKLWYQVIFSIAEIIFLK